MIEIDYLSRLGLTEDPFIKNSKSLYIETMDSKEAVYRLNLLATIKGFGLLTGSPGCGKTTCIRYWVKNLPVQLYKTYYICLTSLTPNDFLRNLAIELGCEPAFRKSDNLNNIRRRITQLSVEKRITPVIVIDEADHLARAILRDLKLLFNFDMDSRDRAVVLLAGLPELNVYLGYNTYVSLVQRIVMNYNMSGITNDEGKNYIEEKLKSAGCSLPVFEDAALTAILNESNGILRIINNICHKALLIASSKNLKTVNLDIAHKAISDNKLAI